MNLVTECILLTSRKKSGCIARITWPFYTGTPFELRKVKDSMATTEFNALEFSDESLTSFIFHLINDAVVIFENCFFTSNILGLFLIFCVMGSRSTMRESNPQIYNVSFFPSARQCPQILITIGPTLSTLPRQSPPISTFSASSCKSATAHRQQRPP